MRVIHVKTHKRGKSVIKAYIRVRLARKILSMLFLRELSGLREKQMIRRNKALWAIQERIDIAISAKLKMGQALLPKHSMSIYDTLQHIPKLRKRKSNIRISNI